MDSAQLSNGVVAVFEEDLLVELLRAGEAHRRVDGLIPGDVEVVDELVEKQAPQALVRA